MLGWLTRCLPGFSLIGLALLLICAFTDILESPMLKDFLPTPPITSPTQNGPWAGLGLAQKIFIIYTVLIHVHTFGFTLRLAWSISRTLQSTKEIFRRRLATSPFPSPRPIRPEYQIYSDAPLFPVSLPDVTLSSFDKKGFITVHDLTEKELIHAIILPNYCEDLHTLETTLKVLASHPRAKSQYEVCLKRRGAILGTKLNILNRSISPWSRKRLSLPIKPAISSLPSNNVSLTFTQPFILLA